MKKNVKKLLSENADKILPDSSVKDNVLREIAGPETRAELAYAHGGTDGGRSAGKRPLLIAGAAVLLAAALFLCIFLPLFLSSGNSEIPVGVTEDSADDSTAGFSGTEQLYAGGAAEAAAVLPLLAAENAETLGKSAAVLSDDGEDNAGIAEFLSDYLSLVETLFGAESLTYETSSPSGDYADYACRMDIVCPGLAGTASYTMYYNETMTDSDEDSADFVLNGILLLDGAEYPVTGTRETETEDDGTEDGYRFLACTDDTCSSCVILEQETKAETKSGKTEYKTDTEIAFRENGETTRTVTAEYSTETKDGETEAKLSLEVEADEAETKAEFKWDSGEGVLEVSYETSAGLSADFEVLVSENAYTYIFDDEKISACRSFGGED